MTRKVEAIFDCRDNGEDGAGTVELDATTNGNDWPDFTEYTPYGEIKLGIDSDAPAADFFEEGETYRVTFEKVED